MKKNDLVNKISQTTGIKGAIIQKVLREFVKILAETLRSGDKISISGLGMFCVKNTKPKKGRNPKTGEIVPIPARKKVSFRPTDGLRKFINSLPQ
jgi:nucleoid DNA-binding protein